MKKETFIAVIITEGIVALVSMGLLFSDVGAWIYLISAVIFAAVLLAQMPDFSKRQK